MKLYLGKKKFFKLKLFFRLNVNKISIKDEIFLETGVAVCPVISMDDAKHREKKKF